MKTTYLVIPALLLQTRFSVAQQITPQSSELDPTIFISEEILLPLPVSGSNINFSISSSGKSAKESSAGIDSIKKKIEPFIAGTLLTVLNRNFSGGTGTGDKLSSTSPILIEEEISISVSEDSLIKVIDSLLSVPQLKISSINPLKDNLFDLKAQTSSRAVKLAIQKATTIAKDQSMAVGDIVDLTVTEEPSAASIREQLEPNKNGNLSSLTETKIIASLRIKLKKK